MGDYQQWFNRTTAIKAVEKLKRNFFNAMYFDTPDEAVEYIGSQIQTGTTVAFGGSMTVRELGLREKAKALGAVLIDHSKPGLSEEEKLNEMRHELVSDVFISSTNAITLEGSLVNVDGHGNRVAAMIFGPRKVILVAGINKIVATEKAAFERLEHIAGPMNMKRLSRETPCTRDAVCHNCQVPARGCRAYTVLRKRPSFTPTDVIIIGQPLGM